jgi:hypothetical protein
MGAGVDARDDKGMIRKSKHTSSLRTEARVRIVATLTLSPRTENKGIG